MKLHPVPALVALAFSLTSADARASTPESYGCLLALQNLKQSSPPASSRFVMKSDSQFRTYRLGDSRVIARLDDFSSEKPGKNAQNSYWSNRRSVTLSIFDSRDRVQAQLNNTVAGARGPFLYQTKTTQYFVRLECDPVTKHFVAR